MEATVHLPRDLTEIADFKRLKARLPLPVALATVWRLFAFLAASAQAGRVGRLEAADGDILLDDLRFEGAGTPDEAARNLAALQVTGWLVPADDGSQECPLFARLNAHLDPGHRPMARVGGLMKEFHRTVRAAAGQGGAQLALLPAETWRLETGRVLTSTEINQVNQVVAALDGILGRADRNLHEGDWPVDLVRSAWGVVEKHTLPVVIWVCSELHRLGLASNPTVPRTTELALQRFEVLRAIIERHPNAKRK